MLGLALTQDESGTVPSPLEGLVRVWLEVRGGCGGLAPHVRVRVGVRGVGNPPG